MSKSPVYIWIDTETTGTDPQRHGIIQVAGIVTTPDLAEIASFDIRLRPFPADVIDPGAMKVNRITELEMANYPDPAAMCSEFKDILAGFVEKFDKTDKAFWLGYNARFDMDFVRQWFSKSGDVYFGSWFWFPPIDVMNLSAHQLMARRPSLQNFKLATVAAALGLTSEAELHDAMADIRLTIEIYKTLMKGVTP